MPGCVGEVSLVADFLKEVQILLLGMQDAPAIPILFAMRFGCGQLAGALLL